MKAVPTSSHGRSLLHSAISKLNPEVFSHPVWIRFGNPKAISLQAAIGKLLNAVEEIKQDDPGGACQVLLMCAVYQSYAGQHSKALQTSQRARTLAEKSNLGKEAIWSLWGICAITFQQGDREQTAARLTDLQAALLKQNEWILADFVEVIRQSLLPTLTDNLHNHAGTSGGPPIEDVFAYTFDWLQRWGLYPSEPDLKSRAPSNQAIAHSTMVEYLFSIRRWQGLWHALQQAMQGKVRLHRQTGNAHAIESPASDISSSSPIPASTREKDDSTRLARQRTTFVPVTVHMLGAFSLTIGELSVKLPASRGLSVLKYLLLHHKQNIPREVLMDVFWPDAEPETARNNLNVAIHGLRTALRTAIFLPVIIFEDGAYGLAPDLQLWLDVEEFERRVKEGQRQDSLHELSETIKEFETAISLYQGDLLEDHPYESWSMLDREHLRITYMDTLDRLSQIYFDQERYAACITVCRLLLTRDRCREDAHCLLMRCYSRQGQYPLALRQYQNCAEALQVELAVLPARETMQLYERIRRHEVI